MVTSSLLLLTRAFLQDYYRDGHDRHRAAWRGDGARCSDQEGDIHPTDLRLGLHQPRPLQQRLRLLVSRLHPHRRGAHAHRDNYHDRHGHGNPEAHAELRFPNLSQL